MKCHRFGTCADSFRKCVTIVEHLYLILLQLLVCDILGHVISKDGISMDPRKV